MASSTLPRSAPFWSVRALLLGLVLACLTPSVIGAAILMYQMYQQGRAQIEKDTIQTARALVRAVDGELTRARVVAIALSTSSFIDTQDWAGFHRRARGLIETEGVGFNVTVTDAAGRPIVDTLRPWGEPLPPHANADRLRRVFETGQPVISDVFVGTADDPRVTVDVPIFVGGKVTYAVSVGIAAEELDEILLEQKLPADWVSSISDSSGTTAARSRLPGQFVGTKVNAELWKRLLAAPEGAFESPTRDGVPALIVFSRSPESHWTVAIAIPSEALQAEWKRSMILLGLGVLLLFAASAGFAWGLGGRIARSVGTLARSAAAMEAGELVERSSVHFREADEAGRAIAQTTRLLRQRSQALQASHETLEEREVALADAQRIAHIGSWSWDARTDAVEGSVELGRLFGRDDMPPFAQQSGTVYPHAAWQQLNDAIQETMRSGTEYDLELPALRADGTPIWINARGEAVRSPHGGVFGVRGTIQDISERKRAEAALRASEAKMAGIIDSAMDAIISVDGGGRVVLFNAAAEEMFRCQAADALGRAVSGFIPQLFLQAEPSRGPASTQEDFAARSMDGTRALVGVRVDGGTFPIEASVSRIDVAGEWLLTVILRDVTDRKEAEETSMQLRAAEEDMRAAVEQSRMKSQFLANMSHELRTPLNAIIGFTGTLLMKLPGALNAVQESQLRSVQAGGRHLLSLINDLLDVASIEAGRTPVLLEPVTCRGIIDEVIGSLRPAAETRGLRLDASLAAGDAVVVADRRMLFQILLNLANNAVKFTDAGVVTIGLVQKEEGNRTLTEISVTDTGIGIRQEDQARLFHAFTQVDVSNTRSHGGTGLGLHLSQKLAGLIGGRIRCSSVFGKGSVFTLVLGAG